MRVHHLSCGSMCPFGALFDGFSKGLHAHLVCHCLLIETDRDGLVLVDTGFGEQDLRRHDSRIATFFRLFNNIQRRPELSALAQVQRLGFQAQDVRHIVLTHLDFDHAGGLTDFPHAQVHVMQQELETIRHRDGWLQQRRYRPAQWPAQAHWQSYRAQGDTAGLFRRQRAKRAATGNSAGPAAGPYAGSCGRGDPAARRLAVARR